MPVDVAAAERFVLEHGRLLDRQRLPVVLHGAAVEPVLASLHAYRNADGGFGHGLEPDVRGPESEPVSTLQAIEVLIEVQRGDDEMVADAESWLASIAAPDGSLPMVMPEAENYPRAPWMVPADGGSHLTFMLAAVLLEAGCSSPWLQRAADWCWKRIDSDGGLSGYWIKAGLMFLDAVHDSQRATEAIASLRALLDDDGSIPVPGGTAEERLRPLVLSPSPGLRSRQLFTAEQIELELDGVEAGQQDDGGWNFDFLAWCPGQQLDWRGGVTLAALRSLRLHGRI